MVYFFRKIEPEQVAIMMGLVKIARIMHSSKKDSFVDLAAYASIAGEIVQRKGKND